MGLLKLAFDRQNKALVDFNGSAVEIPPLYQTNVQSCRIQIVDPTGDPSAPYEAVDCAAFSLRAVLAAAVTGKVGDEAENLLAATYEAGWGWDAGLVAFTGSISLDTAEVAAFLGEAASKPAIFEVNLVSGGFPETVYGSISGAANIAINANADELDSTPPTLFDAATVGTVGIVTGVGGVTIAENVVTITGLGLGAIPAVVAIWINAPSGSGPIFPNFIRGSASTAGFSFIMSGIPENNNYTFTYALSY